jgi:aspartate dehydrogenase
VQVGILGTGAIGSEVARAAAKMSGVSGLLLYDIDTKTLKRVAALVPEARVAGDVGELIAGSDVVVEAATVEAARECVPLALEAGRDVLMMSVGALVDDAFYGVLRETARRHGCKIYLPAGAMAGIDGLRAGAVGGLKSVTLVTTKPPAALGVEVDRWTRVFAGSARDAIEKFPKNVNVAVCLGLAGLGVDRTRVEVVADPLVTTNEHKLIVEGDFGRMRLELVNLPHPDNPRTSYLASLSAIATLAKILDPIQVGA